MLQVENNAELAMYFSLPLDAGLIDLTGETNFIFAHTPTGDWLGPFTPHMGNRVGMTISLGYMQPPPSSPPPPPMPPSPPPPSPPPHRLRRRWRLRRQWTPPTPPAIPPIQCNSVQRGLYAMLRRALSSTLRRSLGYGRQVHSAGNHSTGTLVGVAFAMFVAEAFRGSSREIAGRLALRQKQGGPMIEKYLAAFKPDIRCRRRVRK